MFFIKTFFSLVFKKDCLKNIFITNQIRKIRYVLYVYSDQK